MQKQNLINHYKFSPKTAFFSSLQQKVDHYFKDKKINSTGGLKLHFKSTIQLMIAAGLYLGLIFFTPSWWLALPMCIVLGITMAVLGFNIMHEGGHQSFSSKTWLNKTAAYMLNALGGTAFFWKIKHNINHHTFTNVEGMDSDIDVKPFMRLHSGQPMLRYHRFQHFYWFFLYGISYLVWVFYEDFVKYFSGKVSSNSEPKPIPFKEHLIFWATKTLYLFFYVLLPIYFVGWWPWLFGFLVMTFACGLTTSIVFQLAHVVEGPEFFHHSQKISPKEWAVHQLATTSNFATSNVWLHWMLGGLNFQIEHHLFPRISHIHYPALSRLVKESCLEHEIVYHEHKTMGAAISSHLKHLKYLGQRT